MPSFLMKKHLEGVIGRHIGGTLTCRRPRSHRSYLMIGNYSFTSHDLKDTSVDAVFTDFRDVIYFKFTRTRDNHLLGAV